MTPWARLPVIPERIPQTSYTDPFGRALLSAADVSDEIVVPK
jgi:hypothetical protein